MPMELLPAALLLMVLGACAGLLAGLLGIGGGAVLVPGLYYILRQFGFDHNAMHIAVGTSLLTIIITGTSSAYTHYRKNAVNIALVKQFLPGVVIGVAIGSWVADTFSSIALKAVFASSQILFGSYMLLSSNKTHLFESMPSPFITRVVAAANACLSTLMGVGGGVQNVVFMTICNVPIHKAVATAAAIGPFIALIGAVGFAVIGLDDATTPPYSIGYLNMPAFVCIILTSAITAPLGAHLAHRAPVKTLKRYFSIFMLCIAVKMLMEIW